MKLRDLDARFVRRDVEPCPGTPECSNASDHTTHVYHVRVDSVAEADGVFFLCPKCFAANGGRRGTHGVLCWFEGKVADDVEPKSGRWKPAGTNLEDLTFVTGKKSPSVLLLGACGWHGFVTNGDAA